MESEKEAALKEEQRLLRSMNNRVNNVLANKPKANFSFNTNNNTTADAPKTPVVRATTGTFGAYNAYNPYNVTSTKFPASDTKLPTSDNNPKKVDIEQGNVDIDQGKPEIVKSSNLEYDEEMKKKYLLMITQEVLRWKKRD